VRNFTFCVSAVVTRYPACYNFDCLHQEDIHTRICTLILFYQL